MSVFAELRRLLGGDRPRGRLPVVELRFGSDLTRGNVEALLAVLSGLRRDTRVIFEMRASEHGIRHFLSAEQATLDTVTGQLRGLVPSVRIEPAAVGEDPAWRIGAVLSWPRDVLLRSDAADDAATNLLAALAPLANDETVLVRLVIAPARPSSVPSLQRSAKQPRPTPLLDVLGPPPVPQHAAVALRAKQNGPLLQVAVVVAVASGHRYRAAHLLGRVVAVLRSRRGAYGHLQLRVRRGRQVSAALARAPRTRGVVAPAELAGLVGWPIGAPRLAGVTLGSSPLLLPDRRIPTSGRLLGTSTWPGATQRGLAQPVIGALSHTLCTGMTGSGKSSLMTNLIVSDLGAGRGCLLIDGKGDTFADLLDRIPPARVDDVIVVDPAAAGGVPGLRVFGTGGDPELAADLALGVLRDVFRDSWGILSDKWLRGALVTLGNDPAATLGDLPFVFTDDAYRRRLVGRLDDPMLRATWASFEAMRPAERTHQLGSPVNKISELLGRRVVRSVLAQPDATLDFNDVLAAGRVVLVNLAPGRLGSPAARLIGALVIHQLFTAVQARAGIAPAKRTPFLAYIDEPKVLGDIPVPLDGMFELARGMRVGLLVSVQSVTQLGPAVRAAALTNAATMVAFRQTADDAELLARHLPGVTADGLQSLGAFEMIARIGLGPGDIARPASGRTLPPPAATGTTAHVRAASAARYGRDPKLVDQALADRHAPAAGASAAPSDAPIGRRRRTP